MKKLVRVIFGVLFGAGLLAMSAVDSSAYPVDLYQITNNSGSTYSFSAEVTAVGGTQVSFVFSNNTIGAIHGVYFDDGSVLGTFENFNGTSAGVDFSSLATPANLPAGNTLSPPFVADFSYGSTSSANRVDNGELLGIVFNLAAGKTFADVTDALSSKDLRLGLHVQSLAGGDSESFATPIPSALLLFGSGLVGLVGIGRRKVRT